MKTAEAIKNAAKAYTELQSLGTSNDYQAFIAGAYFASSSKDARIKELEEFIDKDFASIVIQTAGLKVQIKELEARIETAEKVIRKAEKHHQGGHSEIGYELREWLTNKTE